LEPLDGFLLRTSREFVGQFHQFLRFRDEFLIYLHSLVELLPQDFVLENHLLAVADGDELKHEVLLMLS